MDEQVRAMWEVLKQPPPPTFTNEELYMQALSDEVLKIEDRRIKDAIINKFHKLEKNGNRLSWRGAPFVK